MRASRSELAFLALGLGLGLASGYALLDGWFERLPGIPPFVIVLLGLALAEIALGLVGGRLPGTLVRMPVRILAFAVGVAALFLVAGRLA